MLENTMISSGNDFVLPRQPAQHQAQARSVSPSGEFQGEIMDNQSCSGYGQQQPMMTQQPGHYQQQQLYGQGMNENSLMVNPQQRVPYHMEGNGPQLTRSHHQNTIRSSPTGQMMAPPNSNYIPGG